MNNDDWDARPLVQPMLVDLQDPSGRRLRIQTHEWDPPSMTEQIEQLVMSLRGALLGPPVIAAAAPAAPATQLIAPLQSAPAQASSRWLGEAIDDWLREAPKTRDLSDNTVRYTYAPALRVFRELVSTERRPEREPGERLTARLAGTLQRRCWPTPSATPTAQPDAELAPSVALRDCMFIGHSASASRPRGSR